MECPKCGLVNPPTATRCDCGHNFAGSVEGQNLFSNLEDKWKREDAFKDQQWYALAHVFGIPGLLVARLRKFRGRKLLCALVLTAVGGVVVLGWIFATYTGPQLDVTLDAPKTVSLGKPFKLRVHVANSHSEKVILETIDIRQEAFKHFELLSTSPQAESVPQNGFVGLRTWAFKLPFEPGATAMVDLEFRPLHIGTHLLNFQVCNAYYDCSALATDIEVRETQQ